MPIDSLRWYFGDGNTSTAVNPSHTYGSAGSYNACITAYNNCDSNIYCRTVYTGTMAAGSLQGPEELLIYPNPAKETVTVDRVKEACYYHLYSITGSLVTTGGLRSGANSIILTDIPAGVYILEIRNGAGRKIVRICKE